MYKYFNWNKQIRKEELKLVGKTLNENGIVIFPTETVYGIASSALSNKAIDKVYKAKKRPREKAINIMVSNAKEIEKYAYIRNDIERKIIENFMPGQLTIILDKKENFGEGFTKINTIGIRIPDNNIALKILKEVSIPLIVSSANISNRPSGIDPEKIEKDFKYSVDIIIDGGIIEKGIPSTIVRVEDNKIKILREGKITKKQIIETILK
ncbi:MAG: threonylcarbamoyl-AMP synthase [Bacilli bacterium]|nr:threonylcarbamoyl-AMP synthase [Bacilli bacterium]